MPEIKNTRNFRVEDSIWEAVLKDVEKNNERISDVLRRALIEYHEENS